MLKSYSVVDPRKVARRYKPDLFGILDMHGRIPVDVAGIILQYAASSEFFYYAFIVFTDNNAVDRQLQSQVLFSFLSLCMETGVIAYYLNMREDKFSTDPDKQTMSTLIGNLEKHMNGVLGIRSGDPAWLRSMAYVRALINPPLNHCPFVVDLSVELYSALGSFTFHNIDARWFCLKDQRLAGKLVPKSARMEAVLLSPAEANNFFESDNIQNFNKVYHLSVLTTDDNALFPIQGTDTERAVVYEILRQKFPNVISLTLLGNKNRQMIDVPSLEPELDYIAQAFPHLRVFDVSRIFSSLQPSYNEDDDEYANRLKTLRAECANAFPNAAVITHNHSGGRCYELSYYALLEDTPSLRKGGDPKLANFLIKADYQNGQKVFSEICLCLSEQDSILALNIRQQLAMRCIQLVNNPNEITIESWETEFVRIFWALLEEATPKAQKQNPLSDSPQFIALPKAKELSLDKAKELSHQLGISSVDLVGYIKIANDEARQRLQRLFNIGMTTETTSLSQTLKLPSNKLKCALPITLSRNNRCY